MSWKYTFLSAKTATRN